jgi:hypothetical protein
MSKFRDPNKDRLKSQSVLKEQTRLNLKCCVDGCNNNISIFEGPGSDILCREDQLKLIEYGGYGRLDRLHTIHRDDVCSCCGQNVNDDPRWEKAQSFFGVILTDQEKHEIKRRYNHGDHNGKRKSDGGDDSAENIAPMCSFCHWVKTVINNDGRKGNKGDQDGSS